MQTTALAASTHTTTTQLQLVSQVKDAVIGSSTVALFVLAQRGKKQPELRNSALVTLAQRGKRRPKQTLQRVVLPPSYHYTTTTCFVRGGSGMFAACLSSGMFLLSACFGMFDFGMFPSTHTHTLAATGWSCLWSLRQAGPRQILFLACRLSSCRSCGSWSN